MRHDRYDYHRFTGEDYMQPYYSSARRKVHNKNSSSLLDYIFPSVAVGLLYCASVVIFAL